MRMVAQGGNIGRNASRRRSKSAISACGPRPTSRATSARLTRRSAAMDRHRRRVGMLATWVGRPLTSHRPRLPGGSTVPV